MNLEELSDDDLTELMANVRAEFVRRYPHERVDQAKVNLLTHHLGDEELKVLYRIVKDQVDDRFGVVWRLEQ